MAPSSFTTAAGIELKLSPFVLAATRFCLPKILALQAKEPPLEIDKATDLKVEIVVEALRRQNKDVTKEWCDENLQTQELDALILAILEISGLKARGEPAPGEAKGP
jgi:hypothetical protein